MEAGQVVYRLVASEVVTDSDFASWREKRPNREYDDECKACGLSVSSTVEGAQAIRRTNPGLRNYRVAEGILTRDHGVILPTASACCADHLTWWPLDAIDRKEPFRVIEEP